MINKTILAILFTLVSFGCDQSCPDKVETGKVMFGGNDYNLVTFNLLKKSPSFRWGISLGG